MAEWYRPCSPIIHSFTLPKILWFASNYIELWKLFFFSYCMVAFPFFKSRVTRLSRPLNSKRTICVLWCVIFLRRSSGYLLQIVTIFLVSLYWDQFKWQFDTDVLSTGKMVSRMIFKIVNGAKFQLVPLHTRPDLIKSCIELLRQEWPRGKFER